MSLRPLPAPQLSPRVLCIWLPNWPIQRFTQALASPPAAPTASSTPAQPLAPRDLPPVNTPAAPLILATRDARRGQVVAAVNLAGRQAGVRPNMKLSEATALVEAEVYPYEPDEDLEALAQLVEQAQRFSPVVGLEQLDAKLWAGRTLAQPECLLLDVTGIAPLFGGEDQLLQEVSGWLAGQHYFACLALAGSVGAAWGLANFQLRNPLSAAEREGSSVDQPPPCRWCQVPSHDTLTALGPLPIAALRVTKETVQQLRRLGIHTIDQLSQLPRRGLASRLGEQLLIRWDQACGKRLEPILSLQAHPDWNLEQTLEFPTPYRATMEELVRRLTQQLAQRLEQRGEGALRIVCRLDLVESPPLVLQLGLFRPTSDAQHLQTLLVGQLEQQFRSYPANDTPPLWRLSLQATLTAPMIWRQIDLFSAGETAPRQEIARLVDTLSNRLGRKQVLAAKLRRDPLPELSCVWQPLTGRRPDGQQDATHRQLSSRMARHRGEPSRDDPQRRPTQLFTPPLAIQLVASDSTPGRFLFDGRWQEIVDANGPERLESGWWRGPSVRRDYYRVTTHPGGRWWIFQDLHTQQWFLHGLFD